MVAMEVDLILLLLEKGTFLMANLQIQQYPEKMMEFGVHWEAANAELGGTPETEMQLKGGYDRAQFLADRDAIATILEDVEDKENDWQGATFDRDQLRIGLRDRVMQFRKAVQLYLADSRYERMRVSRISRRHWCYAGRERARLPARGYAMPC